MQSNKLINVKKNKESIMSIEGTVMARPSQPPFIWPLVGESGSVLSGKSSASAHG